MPQYNLGGWTPFNAQTQQWNLPYVSNQPSPGISQRVGDYFLAPTYQDTGSGQGMDRIDGPGLLQGYSIYNTDNPQTGDWIDNYDANGNFLGSEQQQENPGLLEGMFKDPLFYSFLAAAGGLGAGLAGGGSAFGGGSGAGVGAANGMWDVLPAAAEGTAGASGAAGAGLGATTYGATGPSAFMQGAGITGAGTGAATGAFTGGSALTNVLGAGSGLGALSGLLGPAATILGGLAGAQGQENESTTKKDIPEWLKPYILGESGLLSQTNNLLQKQMAPGYMAGYDQMRNVGSGLMNTPQQGNGFARFFPGR